MAGTDLIIFRTIHLIDTVEWVISKSDLKTCKILANFYYSLANSSSGISWEILFAITSLAL